MALTTPAKHAARTKGTQSTCNRGTYGANSCGTTGRTTLADESNRIVGELRKLNEAGSLKEPEDQWFFAGLIRTFGATFLAAQVRDARRIANAISLVGTLSAGQKPVAGIVAPRRGVVAPKTVANHTGITNSLPTGKDLCQL
jgi:hypothetical protein